MTIRFNNKFGKEIARRYDARTERTQYGNVLRTLRRTIARVAREGEDVASGICFRDRFESTNRFELGNGALRAAARRVSDDCRCAQIKENSRRFSERIIEGGGDDAYQEGTRLIDVLGPRCRSFTRVASQGQVIAGRTCRENQCETDGNFELGKCRQYAADRTTSGYCESFKHFDSQSFAERINEVFTRKTNISLLTFIGISDIKYSVESDGVRLIFLTARGGAAFLTVRDAVVGRFSCSFPLNPSGGRRSFPYVASRSK